MAAKYPQTMRSEDVVVSTANTGRDGSGTLASAITGVAAGTTVRICRIAATGNTTDGMLRFYVYDGSNNRLIDEMRVPANTPSATVRTWVAEWVPRGGEVLLPSTSHQLRISTHNAETFHVTTEGYDY